MRLKDAAGDELAEVIVVCADELAGLVLMVKSSITKVALRGSMCPSREYVEADSMHLLQNACSIVISTNCLSKRTEFLF